MTDGRYPNDEQTSMNRAGGGQSAGQAWSWRAPFPGWLRVWFGASKSKLPDSSERPVYERRAGFAEEAAASNPAESYTGRTGYGRSHARILGGRPFASTGPDGHRNRMREKVLTRGTDALADYELLEMLLFLAFKKGDTKPLAKRLLNHYGSFAKVLSASERELFATTGLGPHAISAIKIVEASAVRLARAEVMDRPVLRDWDLLMGYLNTVMARQPIEHFRVLFLDNRNCLIADEAQARGTVNHVPVYPREVVKRALDLQASAMILVHNHPSGDPSPSQGDIDMTREVNAAAKALSIVLHDHVIIGNGSWLSFRREGLLP
jgi:DNA repair protein RadC